MKVVSYSRKRRLLKVKVENEDDLWHLSNILTPGTFVKMRTVRKVRIGEEKTNKPATLKVQVESVEYHSYLNVLRVSGKIVEGPEDITLHSYHTFTVEPGSLLVIEKELDIVDLRRLRDSVLSHPRILIVLMDRDEALFATIKASGLEFPVEINSHLPPKSKPQEYEKAVNEYFAEVAEVLKTSKSENLVIAGPEVFKDNFADFLKKRYPQMKFTVHDVSGATRAAVKEVLPKLGPLLAKTSIAKDEKLVEQLMERIHKRKAAYGLTAVGKAIEYGAAEAVLITDALVRESRRAGTYKTIEGLLATAEKRKAKIAIINSNSEAGRKLEGLGGIAAFLRFEINEA